MSASTQLSTDTTPARPATASTTTLQSNESIFSSLEAYPWDKDSEYQHGLAAILGSNPAAEQARHLTLRSRCFYYSRKFNVPVDFAAYQEWHYRHANGNQLEHSTIDILDKENVPDEKPPYPLSFSEIVELITEGKPIPGIKEIPNTVLEGQASESRSGSRKKPWES